MDFWVPPKPAIIRPAEKELIAPLLGITMLARTTFLRKRAGLGTPTVTAYTAAGAGASNSAFGTTAWSSPGNIVSSNNSYAACSIGGAPISSQYLVASSFGFALPASSVVTGIEMRYERSTATAAPATTSRLRVVKGGTVHSANVSTMNVTDWTTSDATITEGGSTNLWGETFTADDINASDFGFAIAVTSVEDPIDLQVDFVEARIYYTPPA